ncbi:hypothetical protein PR002_g32939 [Phytophthora rubi]|uniref:Uncharacterized protein n=1 Tax=Phytophthora rubi TaxID=129364 RepID=A0A6A3G1N7_9STRA|nr:hypothetical protein PR002_g32939 [Phytophthora rubi]
MTATFAPTSSTLVDALKDEDDSTSMAIDTPTVTAATTTVSCSM